MFQRGFHIFCRGNTILSNVVGLDFLQQVLFYVNVLRETKVLEYFIPNGALKLYAYTSLRNILLYNFLICIEYQQNSNANVNDVYHSKMFLNYNNNYKHLPKDFKCKLLYQREGR